jgi:hypothetical protein
VTLSAALITRYRNSPEPWASQSTARGRFRTAAWNYSRSDGEVRLRLLKKGLRAVGQSRRVADGTEPGTITVLQAACAFLRGLTRYAGVIARRETPKECR